MDVAIILFRQNLIMAIYMAIGYALYKKKLITSQGSGELGKLLVYVVMPLIIVKAYLTEGGSKLLGGLMLSMAAAAASLLLSMLISWLFFHRHPMEQFSASFSNAGFIALPFTQAVLGEQAVIYVSSFVAFLNILQWTFGVYVMTGDKRAVSVRKIAGNPVVLGFVCGLLLFFLPVRLPSAITGVVDAISGMNAPLAMIVLGVYLAQLPVREIFAGKLLYACAVVRLLVIPAATLLLLSFLPAEYRLIKLTVLIAASAPVGSNVAIFAQMNGKDYTQAVKEVCLSTVLCILTLPVVVGAASLLWQG